MTLNYVIDRSWVSYWINVLVNFHVIFSEHNIQWCAVISLKIRYFICDAHLLQSTFTTYRFRLYGLKY